jgi:hypothetical protein
MSEMRKEAIQGQIEAENEAYQAYRRKPCLMDPKEMDRLENEHRDRIEELKERLEDLE